MSTGAVLVDRIGDDLALITLNRPDRLNAIDDSLVTGLHAALDRIESDAGVRTVVLTGAGRGFCAGADLKEIPDLAGRTSAELYRGQQRLADLSVRLHELPVPVVAAVNGARSVAGSPWLRRATFASPRAPPTSRWPTFASASPAGKWA